tara:strand:- start:628 stop:1296 length:669 start_codon:yes stop_codon:yes gene_type:complete
MSDEIMEESVDTEPAQETPAQESKTYTQEDMDRVVSDRLARERRKFEKQLDGINLEEARQIMLEREQAQIERQKEKGEFEQVLKQTVEKKDQEIAKLNAALHSTKIDGALLTAANKHNAIDSEQVATLLRHSIRLSDDGMVEVIDANGAVRYNDNADPLTIDEAVSEFLTASPHFVRASQGGAGTMGNAGGSTPKPTSVADMVENWSNGGKEAYAALRKKTQ